MATMSGDLKTKFTDDLGEPLVGGKVYTYHAGTSTPKDSYQDKGFSTVNTNPIILDDAGSCDLYLNGLYRLRVLDKDGVFVEERDYMTHGDSTGSSITDNANNITVLQSEVQAINERSVLKLDENNFVIGHGSANSATVHDPAFRVDKLKIAKKDDAESAKLLFNTYEENTSVEGETVNEGSYIDPDLITQPLVKNWQDVERAAFKGTKKDGNTNLLLKAGDSVPENSAASRLVGISGTEIADNNNALKAINLKPPIWLGENFAALDSGDTDRYYVLGGGGDSGLPRAYWIVDTWHTGIEGYSGTVNYRTQEASNYGGTGFQGIFRRRRGSEGEWKTWEPTTKNKANYTQTTQANPNVTVTESGMLMRSTSSMKYKELIKHLELSADDYEKAMKVNPIVYRSKCDPDPSEWHYLSFSAEELGEYDPALTFWQTHETDLETGEQVELEKKEAEGINLNAICAVLHATNIYQGKKIEELEQRLTALESNKEPIE